MEEMQPEEFLKSLLEADPADLPEIPRMAPMTIADIVDIPTRQARHALVALEGERGCRWQVCVKRGRFERGEKVLFVKKGVLVRDDPRFKTAARSPYRRKKILFRGGGEQGVRRVQGDGPPLPRQPRRDPAARAVHGTALCADGDGRLGAGRRH